MPENQPDTGADPDGPTQADDTSDDQNVDDISEDETDAAENPVEDAVDEPDDQGYPAEDADRGENSGGGSKGSTAFGMSLNVEMSRKYGFEASGAAKIVARIESVAPPTRLLEQMGLSKAQIREIRSRTSPMDAALLDDEADTLSSEDQEWVRFGQTWLEAVAPVNEVVNDLRQHYLNEKETRANEIASILATIATVLTRFPDTDEKVKVMRDFLKTDPDIAAAEGPNQFDLEVKIKSPLLPVLDLAP